ncbi:MAG TPA: carboxypeptidase-like regulatory domain-containing protein [Candidatus Thermoplasmatota archaeon]|nr:carboxypeptidase-like regulatory domain-containing protein [Candidatus Thermoplasmatota archaeon]
MLRPILAFVTLCLAAFLMAPTVASVHQRVTALHIDRDLPWQIWKWRDDPLPPNIDCGHEDRHLYTEVTIWPSTISKDKAFTLRGVAQSEEDGRAGVADIDVEVFLNATKEEPGPSLGTTRTGPDGNWWMNVKVPRDMPAEHYHIVSYAKERKVDCKVYHAAWSDPETDIFANTTIEWSDPDHPVVGRETQFTGKLLDSEGAAVADQNVTLTYAGQTEMVRTNSAGRFSFTYAPPKPGALQVAAAFEGGGHYKRSHNETSFEIQKEYFELDGVGKTLSILRSTPFELSGHVYVAEEAKAPQVTLLFEGTKVATCPTCAANATLVVPLETDGSFSLDLVVPPTQRPGEGTLTITGGGMEETYSYGLSIDVPTTLTLDAANDGLFARGFHGTARLTDETGRPYVGLVGFATPAGWLQNGTDDNGTAVFAGSAGCGHSAIQASFNGSAHVRPSTAERPLLVCGYLAFIPPWLAAVPWWVWPAALLVALAAWQTVRSLRQTYAPVIRNGPPLTLTFTEPADDASGFTGIGEAVVATAFLEQPLPDGHRLRMGTARQTQERPIDADLRAHVRIVPDKLGVLPIRAEIVDAKGRVVSRRTATLHVVRYAQEIERRYLRLRASAGATESVSPREFERWLHERAPTLDSAVARRLVHVFEEADYSPRTAGRAEFSAYLAAERLHLDAAHAEVSAPAPRA